MDEFFKEVSSIKVSRCVLKAPWLGPAHTRMSMHSCRPCCLCVGGKLIHHEFCRHAYTGKASHQECLRVIQDICGKRPKCLCVLPSSL